jgi:hypothetical protein
LPFIFRAVPVSVITSLRRMDRESTLHGLIMVINPVPQLLPLSVASRAFRISSDSCASFLSDSQFVIGTV